ncbi:MAG TPA: outer spore coat protein CotE [Acholeplasmataceae bacterium]|jgi:spore coat protein E|nr:outer spore coat protein CotE [Acholeplasmataceae bacterium]
MNEIREIVTKAIVGKGKKIIRLNNTVTPENEAFSILGCWVINHEFEASLSDRNVQIDGTLEVNIWYSYDNNTRTDVARQVFKYSEKVKTRQIVKDVSDDSRDVIVRILQQPTCTNASINNNVIDVEIVFEVLAEIIGETKMMITVFATTSSEPQDIVDDNFENEINENFIDESKIVG